MAGNRIIANNGSSIVLYATDDGSTQLEVKLEKDTVWLTQSQMAELFGRDRTVISRHIKNIFKEGELEEALVCAKNAQAKKYGRREDHIQISETTFYNLDVIISVGYRVKSINGTKFRIWATALIKQYLIKGYAIDQRRLDHYDELKDVVRLMSRALTLQDKVSEGEYTGLFKVITDYVIVIYGNATEGPCIASQSAADHSAKGGRSQHDWPPIALRKGTFRSTFHNSLYHNTL